MPKIQKRHNKERISKKINSIKLKLINIIFQNNSKFLKIIIHPLNKYKSNKKKYIFLNSFYSQFPKLNCFEIDKKNI